MDILNTRIIEVMDTKGLTKSSFAAKLGVSLPLIAHICSGRNKPGIELIQKVMQVFPDVNPYWLLLGQGNMFNQSTPKADLSDILRQINDLKVLTKEPKAIFKTISSYHKILLDEVMHLKEMGSNIAKGEQVLDKIAIQLDALQDEFISKLKD
ncbi:MAG: helix-turn-helix domain-containing protein [Bacteroidota bacterium]|nr:helix-turn-helix transcriptional regulator [Sphingobacteriales bacterium]